MTVLVDLTEKLAVDVMAAMDEMGDDRLHDRVSRVLLDMSPTTQEAFLTAIKVLLAERKARIYLDATLKAFRSGGKAPTAPRGEDPGH